MIDKLLPESIFSRIKSIQRITELRIRLGSPIVIHTDYGRKAIEYVPNDKDIESILIKAGYGSLYAVNDMINKGYLIWDKGIRIGLTGEGVTDEGGLIGLKHIKYLTVRIPREIDVDLSKLTLGDKPLNTLILSPPGGGKTTLLRALTKYYSERNYNVLLIDERYELAAVKNGLPNLNVGINTDIISGMPKKIAYEIGVRTMRPDIISTDEIYSVDEAESLIEAAYSGVKAFMTAHSKNINDFNKRKSIRLINDITEQVITLSDTPRAGTIINVEVRK